MAKGWKCPRCSTNNGETAMNCVSCGLIRGGVVVPGTHPPGQPRSWSTSFDVRDGEPTREAPAARDDVGAPVAVQPPTSAPWSSAATAPDQDPTDAAAQSGGSAALGGGAASSGEAPSAWSAAPLAKPLWQRLPWGWVLTLVLVGGGAIAGLIFNASRDDTGEISKPGDLTVADLRVGDCYDLKDATATEVEQVTARPCSVEHEYEMFFVGEVTATSFPDSEGFLTYVDEHCLPAFEAFIGMAYADSQLDVFWLEPTRVAWTAGDRTIQCAVYHPAQARLTGSLKGSNQ